MRHCELYIKVSLQNVMQLQKYMVKRQKIGLCAKQLFICDKKHCLTVWYSFEEIDSLQSTVSFK